MKRGEIVLDATTPDDKVHGGHRRRMREKLMRFGDRIFDEHELLEMILYHVIPMRDTNPIAHRLLATFGSLEGVFSASREELMKVDGVKEKAASLLIALARFGDYPFFARSTGVRMTGLAELGGYFAERIGKLPKSETYMMMLTNSMELIGFEQIYDGDFCYAEDAIPSFIIRALTKGAAVVILGHNHPNGPLFLTPSDHFVTTRAKSDFAKTGILLLEHFVVSGSQFATTIGKIDNLQFFQTPEISEFIKEREALSNVNAPIL